MRRDPINLRQVDAAGQVKQRRAHVEGRGRCSSGSSGGCADAGSGADRRGDRGGERAEVAFDRRVALGDLRLAGVEDLEILLQHEEVVGLIVAGQRGDHLGRRSRGTGGRDAGRGARDRAGPRRCRAECAARSRPVMSLTTSGNCRFISTRAFCIRWMKVLAVSTRVWRWRRYVRSATMPAVGRKLPRSRPTLCNSRNHSQSDTSLFRPGTFLKWRALTRRTSKPRASRIS